MGPSQRLLRVALTRRNSSSENYSAATPHAAYRPQCGRKAFEEILRLPFRRRTTPEFIEEVLQEDDVVPRLPSLGWHHRHNALAIRGEINVLAEIDCIRKRLLGPEPRLVR